MNILGWDWAIHANTGLLLDGVHLTDYILWAVETSGIGWKCQNYESEGCCQDNHDESRNRQEVGEN